MTASHSCCRFLSCTSMVQISHSTKSKNCSIRLSSGGCRGHLTAMASTETSVKGFATWCTIVLALWSWRDGHDQQQYSGKLWCLDNADLELKGSKCAKKSLSHTIPPASPTRSAGTRLHFRVVYAKCWPYHLTVPAEIKTCFSSLLLSDIGELVWIIAAVTCS